MNTRTITFDELPQIVGQILDQLNRIEEALQHEVQGSKDSQDQILSVKEAAKFLNLAPATIYTMVSKGLIPYHKKTKRIYFFKIELINYLKSGRRQTIEEIQNSFILTKKKR